MVYSVIKSGLRRSDIYPCNPEAFYSGVSIDESKKFTLKRDDSKSKASKSGNLGIASKDL